MALEIPQPPEESRQVAIKGLQLSEKNVLAPGVHALAANVLGGAPHAISDPHQVFTLDRRDIVAGSGLEAAKADAWRYLVRQAGGIASGGSSTSPTEVAEVTEKNGVHTFSHRQSGWLAQETHKAMNNASKLPEVGSGSYELRLLRLPSIYVDALWLKNKGAGEDLVVPIASKSPDVVAGQTYTGEGFMSLVRDLAQKPSFDNSPRPAQP